MYQYSYVTRLFVFIQVCITFIRLYIEMFFSFVAASFDLKNEVYSYVAHLFRHVCFVYGLFMCSALVSANGF